MGRKSATRFLTICFFVASALWSVTAQELTLPNAPTSLKFMAMGDSGSGDREQFEVANQMARFRAKFPFDMAIMLGDNIYGGQGASDLDQKFAQPYKALLDAGVTFYASLGNHDDPINRQYPLWNMGGQMYYTYAKKNVRFFALDSNKVDQKQLAWLESALKSAQEEWKICYFHAPLVFGWRHARLRHRHPCGVRAAVRHLWRQRGVRGPRPHLRAHHAAEGHRATSSKGPRGSCGRETPSARP